MEYFEDFAWYIDPLSVESISRALKGAFKSNKNEKLSERIQSQYSWKEVGKKTIEAYDCI
jgi:hypothetical protein